MKRTLTILAIAASTTLAGCVVTKPLGREESVSQTERTAMTCHDVDLEIARSKAFVQRVNDESNQNDGRDFSAFMLDWGIGNRMEKDDALKSAQTRQQQLETLRTEKNCPLSTSASQ